jgi:hypothetical protein
LNDEKTLKISPETHIKLLKIGTKSETFDEIISRLCDFWERYKDVIER